MYHVVVQGKAADRRSEIMAELERRGIETREGFIPFNMQEIFVAQGLTRESECPRANAVAMRGFYLPSGAGLDIDEVNYVADNLIAVLESL
jgi:perosamine synthetase